MAGCEIVLIVPNKRCIGMNRVPSIRRVISCWVEEASNSESVKIRLCTWYAWHV